MNLITVNMNALIKYKNSLIAKTSAICIYQMYQNNKDIASVKAKDIPFAGGKMVVGITSNTFSQFSLVTEN